MKMHNQNCKGIDYWCNRVARIRYGYPRYWIVPNIVYFFLSGAVEQLVSSTRCQREGRGFKSRQSR